MKKPAYPRINFAAGGLAYNNSKNSGLMLRGWGFFAGYKVKEIYLSAVQLSAMQFQNCLASRDCFLFFLCIIEKFQV